MLGKAHNSWTKVIFIKVIFLYKIIYYSIRLICVILTHMILSWMVQYLLSYELYIVETGVSGLLI